MGSAIELIRFQKQVQKKHSIDDWLHLAQADLSDQDWSCQGKSLLPSLTLTWPDVTWSWLYPVLAPACLGLGCDWPDWALTLDGLSTLDLSLA